MARRGTMPLLPLILLTQLLVNEVYTFYLSHRIQSGKANTIRWRTITARRRDPCCLRGCHHNVDGIDCIEIKIDLPRIGEVSILEATAESQDILVNIAIEEYLDPSVSSPVLAAGDPYGSVLWPACTACASYLLTHKDRLLQGKSVLELGTGTGLIAQAAALGGAKSVLATDYEAIPLRLLQYSARHLNNITDPTILKTQYFDICDFDMPLPEAEVVVAADIMYEPRTGKAMARRAVEALKQNSYVLIGDSPGRAGRPAFLQELQRLGVVDASFVDTVGSTVVGARHELICGKDSMTVSETPQKLVVAIMELDPQIHLKSL